MSALPAESVIFVRKCIMLVCSCQTDKHRIGGLEQRVYWNIEARGLERGSTCTGGWFVAALGWVRGGGWGITGEGKW